MGPRAAREEGYSQQTNAGSAVEAAAVIRLIHQFILASRRLEHGPQQKSANALLHAHKNATLERTVSARLMTAVDIPTTGDQHEKLREARHYRRSGGQHRRLKEPTKAGTRSLRANVSRRNEGS